MVDPLFSLRHDFKWVPRSHMYIMIFKLKTLRKIVLKNNAKNGKRESKATFFQPRAMKSLFY